MGRINVLITLSRERVEVSREVVRRTCQSPINSVQDVGVNHSSSDIVVANQQAVECAQDQIQIKWNRSDHTK